LVRSTCSILDSISPPAGEIVERALPGWQPDRLPPQRTDDSDAGDEGEPQDGRPVAEQWQAEGKIREGDPDAIAGAVRAVVFLTLHREDIGENYEAVRDTLIEVVADGLVTE